MKSAMKQQLFEHMDEHLFDEQPSSYFNRINGDPILEQFPLSLLTDMRNVPQSPQFHPEGNVWNHTMMVIDEAAIRKKYSNDRRTFLWAALLHDIGKKGSTKHRNGRITAYDHDKLGAELSKDFLSEFTEDTYFINKVSALVRWHMQILFVVKSLKFADIQRMKEEVDIREVALLGFCDRMGRLGADRKKEEENIRIFLDKCGLRR